MRVDYFTAAPGVARAMLGLEGYLNKEAVGDDKLPKRLLELVKIRASQLNHCAYCLDMHTKDARAAGETEQRIYALNAWRETPFFDARERAALSWTEALTQLTDNRVTEALFEQVRACFSDRELSDLTLAIAAINAWNRFGVGFAPEVGGYQPA
ncbi:alkylhydroperoxidase AhpD family core domain-containing protein [Halopseudomonas sabulinigri]|uniref:Alkylhydroperoxidase AhpD family core domain-containing protein n=1 Tax=Halopseudomonas sabulinigri TaxID=472181 RepID=A0A1H1W1T4_9GAMM|nr:carboxymuconolactone decarboxylase family protein [Halopseudomonas sabulinigri]SDS91003.1 alkylhydroperoxidase AhpD family core domain-containing protein [Halopseudomonas sabulinigri]